MDILESWEDDKGHLYTIVRHSKEEQEKTKVKAFEVMYLLDEELKSFGGSVGYNIADFDSPSLAEEYLLKGIYLQDTNPDIWLEMVQV